jgi:lipoprotein-releasing system ATP-binding protein
MNKDSAREARELRITGEPGQVTGEPGQVTGDPQSEITLRAVDLTKIFRSGSSDLVVLEELNLAVQRGEMVAIVGESGAGKSTLLHILGTVDRPTSGEVYLKQKTVTGGDVEEVAGLRNREIGFVWQFHYLLPEFSALENVTMPLRIRGIAKAAAERRGRELLSEVGLAERIHHRPGELSGGEQQRVALARALVGQPSLLLADEPTGNLDLRTGDMVFRLIEQLHRNHNLTSVVATHNPAFAERCHRVLCLSNGRLWPAGKSTEH